MSVERIGIPDGSACERQHACSGALLVVNRDEYLELKRHGLVWSTKLDDIPPHGKASARVWCNRDEEMRERNGVVYRYGLCTSCSDMEANARRDAANRQVNQ